MKQRSNSYLRTFQNTPEGIAEYKEFITNVRKVGIVGGRFLKMFRGNKRKYHEFVSCMSGRKVKMWNGCNVKEGATHFDVYLVGGSWVNGKRSEPRFFNFVLENRPR